MSEFVESRGKEAMDRGARALAQSLTHRARALSQALAVPGDHSENRLTFLARQVSHLGSPPVMATAAYLLAAAHLGLVRAWVWMAIHLGLAVVFPLVVLLLMVRRREVSDLELTRRSQRALPLMFTFTLTGYSLFLMEAGAAPLLLREFTLSSSIALLAAVLITRHWKISLHTTGVALCGTLVWKLTGSVLLLTVGCGIMGLARVYLGRHTPVQAAAGALLGFASCFHLL